jgi:hypothetical protein
VYLIAALVLAENCKGGEIYDVERTFGTGDADAI